MKKIILITLALAAFLNLGAILDVIDPPPNFSSIAQGSVVVYTTSSCGYCYKTKKFLTKMGVSYSEVDIEKSREGYQQYAQLGGQGVPVIVIGKSVIYGYGKDQIIEALRKI